MLMIPRSRNVRAPNVNMMEPEQIDFEETCETGSRHNEKPAAMQATGLRKRGLRLLRAFSHLIADFLAISHSTVNTATVVYVQEKYTRQDTDAHL